MRYPSTIAALCSITAAFVACNRTGAPQNQPIATSPQPPSVPVAVVDVPTLAMPDVSALPEDAGATAVPPTADENPPQVTTPTVGFRCRTSDGPAGSPESSVDAWLAMPGQSPQFITRHGTASGNCESAEPADGALLGMLLYYAGAGLRVQLVRQRGVVLFRERSEDEEAAPGRWRTVGQFTVGEAMNVAVSTQILHRTSPDAAALASTMAAVSTVDLTRQLATLPSDSLRLLIAPEGLNVCTAHNLEDERFVTARRRCQLKTSVELTDAELTALRRAWRFSRTESSEVLQFSGLRCTRTGDSELCRGTVAGPAGTQFEYRYLNGVRYLHRVVAWSLSS